MRDLLLLMRAPLAAGAASNLLVGALLALEGEAPRWEALALLALGACCAYWAGMVWNDVFDLERDRELAPGRPLPSGRVSSSTARLLGGGLTLAGVALTTGAAAWLGVWLRGLLAGAALAGCVLAYDGALKRLRLPGSLAMGACRGVNALAPAAILVGGAALLRPSPALAYAALLTLYVSSLTWLSTFEDDDAPTWAVVVGFVGVALGPAATAAALLAGATGLSPLGGLPLLVLLPLALVMARRTLRDGTQARGKANTLVLLKSIWLIDLSALIAVDADWPWLLALFALWLAGRQGARALFAKPRT